MSERCWRTDSFSAKISVRTSFLAIRTISDFSAATRLVIFRLWVTHIPTCFAIPGHLEPRRGDRVTDYSNALVSTDPPGPAISGHCRIGLPSHCLHEAFLGHAHWEAYEGRAPDQEAFRLGLVSQVDWRSDQSVTEAVNKLKHDEHIDSATCSGRLNTAFCIQLSDSGSHAVDGATCL